MSASRAAVARTRRVVVKLGSRTIAADPAVFSRIAQATVAATAQGRSVVIVSSGAIALGVKKLQYRARPKEIAKLQAAAAAGQSVLMGAYDAAFRDVGLTVAQVLLTHADLSDRVRANNAREAIHALLDAGAVPILNENDSVAVEEIKFGDNDALSSMVVPLVDADLLVLLSDVDGLLDARGERVRVVKNIEREALPLVRASKSDVGTGGMASKLEAARRANLAGAHAIIADARVPDIVGRALSGDDVGTLFISARKRISAKKHWIAFTLRPRGDVVLDAGAVVAVRDRGKSVLAVGVLGVRGDFDAGDAVRILAPTGEEIGRGLARRDARSAVSLAGPARDGAASDVLVHRDEMVVWTASDDA